MISFPNCKINIGLYIVQKRSDGYHDLETVFYPVALEDALEVVPSAGAAAAGGCRLFQSGNVIAGAEADNLVVKAYHLLVAEHQLGAVDVYLHKRIPSGAGLGGGSADAAFMLRMLNEMFELGLSVEQLRAYAGRLGADCPFFISNAPVMATGTGDVFSPVPELSLAGYGIVIVKPNVFVSTKEAFAHVVPRRPAVPLAQQLECGVQEWRDVLGNDFEESIFPRHPEIKAVKDLLYGAGAVYASMSGSGSSVYGLFKPGTVLPDVNAGTDAFIFKGVLG